MNQERRFRAVQPALALARINDGDRKKGWGGRAWSCVDSMVQYLYLLFLLAKTLHGVFRALQFKARLDGLQSKPSVGRL